MSQLSDFIIIEQRLSEYHGHDAELVIPEGIAEIPAMFFSHNDEIRRVVIPEGVKTIGDSAFRFCRRLEEVIFPSTVTEIGADAFCCCSSLKEVDLSHVEKLGAGAFSNCYKLEKAVMTDALVSMGKSAFEQTVLTSAHISASLKSIPAKAFHSAKLTRVEIPGNVRTVGDEAFYMCPLEEAIIHEGVTRLGAGCFSGSTFSSLQLPESLTAMHMRGLNGCKYLTQINFPLSIQTLHPTAWTWVGLPVPAREEAPWIIDHWLLQGQDCPVFHIPEEVRKVATGAFFHCNSLTELHISGHDLQADSLVPGFKENLNALGKLNLISAPEYALEEFPEQLRLHAAAGLMNLPRKEAMDEKTHEMIRNLMSADASGFWVRVLPQYPEMLGYAMTHLLIPGALADAMIAGLTDGTDKDILFALVDYKGKLPPEEIPAGLELNDEEPEPFVGLSMTLKEAKKLWTVKKLEDNTWRISAYKGKDQEMQIPGYIDDLPVTVIGKSPAAAGVVTTVWIPDTVTTLESAVFKDYTALSELYIGKEVTVIADKVFMGCTALTEVELPPKVEMIRHWLFAGCTKIHTLRITGRKTAMEGESNFLRYNRKAVIYIRRDNEDIQRELSMSSRKIEFL